QAAKNASRALDHPTSAEPDRAEEPSRQYRRRQREAARRNGADERPKCADREVSRDVMVRDRRRGPIRRPRCYHTGTPLVGGPGYRLHLPACVARFSELSGKGRGFRSGRERDRGAAIRRKILQRSGSQSVRCIPARRACRELLVDFGEDDPAPRPKGVPAIGESGLVAEERILLRASSTTEMKDASAHFLCPKPLRIDDEPIGRELQKDVARSAQVILNDP